MNSDLLSSVKTLVDSVSNRSRTLDTIPSYTTLIAEMNAITKELNDLKVWEIQVN